MLSEHRTLWMEDGRDASAEYAMPRAYLCSGCHVVILVKSGAHKGPRRCPSCKNDP